MYGSEDGSTWAPIVLASTSPAPAGGTADAEHMLPAGSLPAGVNRIKLVLGRGTEIAQVNIMGGRSGPACLARTPAAHANSLAGLYPGTSPAGMLGSIACVVGATRSRARVAICVTRRRASLSMVPTPRGRIDDCYDRARLPARRHRPGSSLASLHRRYGITGLRALGSRLLVTPGGQLFVIRSRRVTAVALVGRSVLAKPGASAAARLAALGRPVVF